MLDEKLEAYVEQISDDFQSTFTVVGENTLANMLGFPGDFEALTKIVRNYIPEANLEFTKTNTFPNSYDVYLIKLKPASKHGGRP